MKKFLAGVLSTALLLGALTGCGSSPAPSGSGTPSGSNPGSSGTPSGSNPGSSTTTPPPSPGDKVNKKGGI